MRSDGSVDGKYIKGIQSPANTALRLVFLLIAIFGLNACGESGEDFSKGNEPQIDVFFATPSAIPGHAETAVTWRWTYLNFPGLDPVCIVDKDVGAVTSGSTTNINITQDTTFTLTCKNDGGTTKSTVRINAVTPGEVWGWGQNDLHQLGNGTLTNRNVPVKVVGLKDVIAVSGGLIFSMALTTESTVWAWGSNSFGSLGRGSFDDYKYYAGRVIGINNAVAISAGAGHALALLDDGTVWAWGFNSNGQLGDGTTQPKAYPVQVEGLTEIIQIQTAYYGSLALQADGTVWAWGDNQYGQLGDRTTKQRTRPIQVQDRYTGEPLAGVASITSCFGSNYAVKADGTVLAWGLNYKGQVGDGTVFNRYTPVSVNDLTNTLTVVAGKFHAIVLREDETVFGWGWNTRGQLGTAIETGNFSWFPFELTGLGDVKSITAGSEHTVILKDDGTLRAFGWNEKGQLGNSTYEDSNTLVQVQGLAGVSVVEAGLNHTLAIVIP